MKMQIFLTKENKQSTPLSILPFNWIRAIGGEKGPIGFNPSRFVVCKGTEAALFGLFLFYMLF